MVTKAILSAMKKALKLALHFKYVQNNSDL